MGLLLLRPGASDLYSWHGKWSSMPKASCHNEPVLSFESPTMTYQCPSNRGKGEQKGADFTASRLTFSSFKAAVKAQ